MTKQVKRVVLEPLPDDPSRFRATVYALDSEADTEGHLLEHAGQLEIEPLDADDEATEPTYRLRLDGDDVQGQLMRAGGSDRRLKVGIIPVVW